MFEPTGVFKGRRYKLTHNQTCEGIRRIIGAPASQMSTKTLVEHLGSMPANDLYGLTPQVYNIDGALFAGVVGVNSQFINQVYQMEAL